MNLFAFRHVNRCRPRALPALVAIVLAAASSSHAAEPNCTDRPECWPEGSAMHTGLLLVQKQRALDAELAAKHVELLHLVASSSTQRVPVDARLLDAIRTQQTAWLGYRSQECELVGTLTGAGGSWPSTYAVECEVRHAEQRLQIVAAATRCVQTIPPSDRLFEQNGCLQPLAPLTNTLPAPAPGSGR